MTRTALIPAAARTMANQMKLSPGIVSGNHVFLTGMTGSGPDGAMPKDLDDQFRQAFEKIGAVLREAGLGFDAIVEMTSYHIGLRDHFDRLAQSARIMFQTRFPLGLPLRSPDYAGREQLSRYGWWLRWVQTRDCT
jgi:enamine deaminase RidA (YjgF/YER057c/UK114 family)